MHNKINSELALFEAFITENPSSQLFMPLAETYLELNRAPDAITVIERALPFHPQHIGARLLLASLYQKQQKPQEALPHLRRAALILAEQGQVFAELAAFIPQHAEALQELAAKLKQALPVLGGVTQDYENLNPAQLKGVLNKLESLRKAASLRYSLQPVAIRRQSAN